MAAKRNTYLKCFGEHLKSLREKKEVTQFELASIIGKDRQSIQRVEAGNINPTIYYLQEVAEGLQIPLKDIVDFKIPEKKKK